MIVAIQTDSEIATDLRRPSPVRDDSRRILSTVTRLHGLLRSTFAPSEDPDLGSHFFVEIGNPVDAKKLVASLAKASGVKAAYIQPHDEAP